ncbi:MAG: MAPEG family protein [Rhizobiaceae bacterium]
MYITALYAALLTPLFIYLSVQVIKLRRSEKVGVGDGDNKLIVRAMRVQANFAEYVPFALLLLAFAESLGTSSWLMHGLGIALLLGRLSHAYGVSRTPEQLKFRVRGMMLTFAVLAIAAIACLYGSLAITFSLQ